MHRMLRVVVSVVMVTSLAATVSCSKSKGKADEASTGSASGAGSAAAPASPAAGSASPAAGSAPTPAPAVAKTGLAECDAMVEAAERVKACDAVPANLKPTFAEMVENKTSALKQGVKPGSDYAKYVAGKCLGTTDALTQALTQYKCK